MRPMLGLVLLCPIFAVGCAMSTETFAPEAPPIDMPQVQRDLNDLFTFSLGVDDVEPPVLLPVGSAGQPAERIEELARALREETLLVAEYREQGCIGENNRGYLELQECPVLAAPDMKNDVQKLLAAVNKTRKALYYELALFYHHGELTVGVIEDLAALNHLSLAATGHRVQLPPIGARFERFQSSALGTALGDDARADGWVSIP